jgi:hypothetical protein
VSGEPPPAAAGRIRQPALTDVKADPGLCGTCLHLRLQASARSVFVRCGLAEQDPRFPRYPPLPVRSCAGFQVSETHLET